VSTEKHRNRVLITDDSPDELRILAYILEADGCQVLQAPNGIIALQVAERAIPDLIMLDIQMPEMDGFEACRQLKMNPVLKDIPVIFVSGMHETLDKVKAFQLGSVDYITKPYQRDELLARVRTHLRLHELTEHLDAVVRERTQELALANQQLQLEIHEREQAQQLEDAVYRIAQAANQVENLEKLFPEIHAIICDVMNAENFYIALYDEVADLLSFPFYLDAMDQPPETAPLGKGLTEYVLQTGKTLLCDQSLFNELIQDGKIDQIGTPSAIWLGTPLEIEGRMVGVMAVQHYGDSDIYGPREQRILEYVSSQVTEAIARKRGEEALKASEMRYRAIVEDQTELVTRWLPDGTRTFVNDAYCRYYGKTYAELIGLSFFPFVENDSLDDVLMHIRSLSLDNPVVDYEEHTTGPKGDRWLAWRDRGIFDETGQLQEVQSVGRDITENKLAQEQIQRQIRRLAALRAIDTAISTSFNLQVTLSVLLNQVLAQLDVDAAAISLLDPHTQNLVYSAQRGFNLPNSLKVPPLRLGAAYAGRVALERKMIHIPDLHQAPETLQTLQIEGEGFTVYFGIPLMAKGQVKGVLEIYHRAPLHPPPDWRDFLDTLAGQAAIAIDNAELFEGLERTNMELTLAYNATLEGWARALELRDAETKGHSERVVKLTMALAEAFGISDQNMAHIYRGALLHDIGKMGVPDHILSKPGPLTEDEWAIMRRHPVYAFEMLSPIHYLRPALDIPHYHHEKWDGSGYPRGLKGNLIPLSARIFSVIDVWDALSSDRPYRAAWPKKKVLAYIEERRGTDFDPQVVDKFMKLIA
jgi:PAS domain S-box-containing protein